MKDFTTAEIKDAWGYAELAYSSAEHMKLLCKDAITIIDPRIEGIGDSCYILRCAGNTAVVMFPGSNDVVDWVLNLDAHESHGFHDGFLDGIESMADEILARLAEIRPTSVLITGHSRGGALADILIERYAHRLSDMQVNCITFAQPRIATSGHYQIPCAKQLPNVRYLRVHTASDPVPHLPPSKFGFTHYGRSMEIGPKFTRWKRLQRWWNEFRHGKIGALITGDHLVPAYRSAINNL